MLIDIHVHCSKARHPRVARAAGSQYPTPKRLIEMMRAHPNLHGDLSAGSGHNALSRDPAFGVRFLNEFQDRLYFGTDIATTPGLAHRRNSRGPPRRETHL